MSFFSRTDGTAEVRKGLPEVYPRLWRYCVGVTGRKDWGEDLVQATCLRAIEQSAKFEPGTHLDRWLFRMAMRLWLNELRSRKVRTGSGLVPVEEAGLADTIQLDTETNILAREVLTQVNGLPEAQRQTVMVVYVEGFSYAEAAEILDIPIGTVMSRLAAARKKLNTMHSRDERSGT